MSKFYSTSPMPNTFFWRRLQSLMGLFLVLFLFEHLLTNSQAALLIGDDGRGFIRAVNSIHNLPYLPVIEILLLGVPFLIHGIWGAVYLRTSKTNSWKGSGSGPALNYPRNKAYTWQRLTSYILIVGIIAHVVHMRFLKYPSEAQLGTQRYWMAKMDQDPGLDTVAARLGVTLMDSQEIRERKDMPIIEIGMNKHVADLRVLEKKHFVEKLEKHSLGKGQVVAVAKDFGTAELLIVRETFKIPAMIVLYTIFVLASCYHGFNGLWTFFITWGVTLTAASQRWMRRITTALMLLVAFFGLAAAWGTYWINLKY